MALIAPPTHPSHNGKAQRPHPQPCQPKPGLKRHGVILRHCTPSHQLRPSLRHSGTRGRWTVPKDLPMQTAIRPYASAFALCAVLGACTTAPGYPYGEAPDYPVYPPQTVYLYPQPLLIRPYPVAPPPPVVFYGRPYGDERYGWNRAPAFNGHWRDRDRDRDRFDRNHGEPEGRGRHDREAPRGRPPEGMQPPPPAQSPGRGWRDARPPGQAPSAHPMRGRGPWPSDPANR